MSILNDISEEKVEFYLDEMITETLLEEDCNKKLLNEKYKDCFNAIIFNGQSWNSEQNLYSNLESFQEIDKLVYIISDYSLMYYKKVSNNNCKQCYLEHDEYIYYIEMFHGQGIFARLTLVGEIDDSNIFANIKFKDVLNWINTTDEWRMFTKNKLE